MSQLQGFVDGKRIKVGQMLGEGHFKVVYESGDLLSDIVYAFFKPAATPYEQKLNTAKVLTVSKIDFPTTIYGPQKPIMSSSKGGDVVGFQARKYPANVLQYQMLADTVTWTQLRLNQSTVTKALLNLCRDVVAPIHKAEACIGDFSSANVGFLPPQYRGVGFDVDSYQFTHNGQVLPCLAGTQDFLAPRFLNGNGGNFTPEDDLWSLMIIIGQSLLRVHPFREGDNGSLELRERISKGLHVLNPDLRYPPSRVANPLTSLPNSFIGFLKETYDAQKCTASLDRIVGELEALDKQWLVCNKHPYPLVYAQERGECPHCQRDRSVPTITVVVRVGATIKFVLVGDIKPAVTLFSKVVRFQGSDAFFLAKQAPDNTISCEWVSESGGVLKKLSTQLKPERNIVIDANEDYVVISTGDDLNVYGIESGKLEHTLNIQKYQQRPIASLGQHEPVLLNGSNLSRAKVVYGQMFPEPVIPLTSANSVWLTSSGASDADISVGFTNLWGSYQWFVYSGRMTLLNEVKSGAGEVMTDWQVVFDGQGFALIRRLQNKAGQSITHLDCFDGEKRLFSTTTPSKVQGKAAFNAHKKSLFLPTDDGICKVTESGSNILLGSENISPASQLLILGGHLYLVDEVTGQIAKVVANK